jgi:xylulokinase
MAGMMAGAVVDWMARLFEGETSPASLEQLVAEASSAPAGANGVVFEPYLAGSGPPHRDSDAWGGWLGLRLNHSRRDLYRAGMEGLTFGFLGLLESMQAHAGVRIAEIRAVGGGTRNTWWQQLKADILGRPIQTLGLTDVAALGAALLAGIGVGIFPDAEHTAAAAFRPGVRYEPDQARHAYYHAALRPVYEKLYPALRALGLG